MKKYDTRLNGRITVSLAALTIATGLGFTTQANAQSNSGEDTTAGLHQIEDVGGPQRINYSGWLRMLTQRLTVGAAILSRSPDSEFVKETLIEERDNFDMALAALRDGNDELGIIGAETDRRIVHNLDIIAEQWVPFRAAIDGILSGDDVDKNLEFIAANNMVLRDAVIKTIDEISREYSNPAEMSAASAMLVNISGRQRMLLHKLVKEYCGVIYGVDALGTQEDMDATILLFNAVLQALLNGQPDAGILPPPTDEIRQKLQIFIDDWSKVEAILKRGIQATEVNSEVQIELFKDLTREVKQLSELVRLYALAAKVQ